MYDLEFGLPIAAPPSAVFAKVSDHKQFFRGWPIEYCHLPTHGVPAPNGLGAVRELRCAGVRFTERITHFEPDVRIDYLVTACTYPLRHEGGRTDFEPKSGGTYVRWRTRFWMDVPFLAHQATALFAAGLRWELLRLLRRTKLELEFR